MSVATYTKTGNKASTPAKLDKKVFGNTTDNHQVLKEAYLVHLANKRTNLAVVKRRGEVRGGGAKPWRQKGTGRARVGSSRSPIWRGGGITFGPSGKENFSHKINNRTKKEALRQALSLAANENRIKIIEALVVPGGKTKSLIGLLDKIDAKGRVLLVSSQKVLTTERSAQNLSYVKLIQPAYLSVLQVLNADVIVVEKDALQVITDKLTNVGKILAKGDKNA